MRTPVDVMVTSQIAAAAMGVEEPARVLPAEIGEGAGLWFLHPLVDLLFCCGGALWLVIAGHFLFHWHIRAAYDGPGVLAGSIAALIGVVFLSDAHNAATLVRLYGPSGVHRQFPLVSYAMPVALAALCVASIFSPALLAMGLRIYLLLITQHLTSQAYGISLRYCSKWKYILDRQQKQGLQFFFVAVMIFGMVQQIGNPKFASLDRISANFNCSLPQWCLQLSYLVLATASLFLLFQTMSKAITRKQSMPPPVVLITASTAAVFLFSPDVLKVFWLYVPAFFHGSQYLIVNMSMKLKEIRSSLHSSTAKATESILWERMLGYWCWLIVIGVTIYVGVPTTISHYGFNIITAFNAVFWTVNLHHFCTDAVIWKTGRRTPKLRENSPLFGLWHSHIMKRPV